MISDGVVGVGNEGEPVIGSRYHRGRRERDGVPAAGDGRAGVDGVEQSVGLAAAISVNGDLDVGIGFGLNSELGDVACS